MACPDRACAYRLAAAMRERTREGGRDTERGRMETERERERERESVRVRVCARGQWNGKLVIWLQR